MKIFCIGRNYADHVQELNNPLPDEPVVFMKPGTALLKNNKPFYLPDFSEEVHYEAEMVLKINRNGKHIPENYAHKYFDSVTLGLDLTARDIQKKLKAKRVSWELAKAFDNSAVVGEFIECKELPEIKNIEFGLYKNNNLVQKGHTSLMIFSCGKLISFVSRFFTLQTGDLIFTGTPGGVGPVAIGDLFEGRISGKKVFQLEIK